MSRADGLFIFRDNNSQCARRHIHYEYPKESRRGQHKRTRRKKTHDHDVNESSPLSAH
jgi:hypothetical protein